MERVPMTKVGYDKIRADLQHIKSVERPKNIRDIEEARAHGDLKENAEYHAAKEKQAVLQAQMNDLENKVSLAEVIDPASVNSDKVVFGATVTLYDVESEDEVSYQIVGDVETNVKEGKIGISSPIAKGLLGKAEDDEVKIRTPKGVREFEVVKIEYK
jgi:transcription elongation factor GreA